VHAVSQIIERNVSRLGDSRSGLWINPETDEAWRKTGNNFASLKLFCQDYATFSFLQRSGADVSFSAFPQTSEGNYHCIILNLPRQKALLGMMLDCAASLLAEDGFLWLAGEKKAGIKSAEKFLKSRFGRVSKLDNARHCILFEAAHVLKNLPFDPKSYRQEWPLSCAQTGIQVISYPGVFAHGRLDEGTALLLEALSGLTLEGEVLDFACGAGLIGACIAAMHPHTRVTLLDTSALALRATEETLAGNQLTGSVIASDGLSDLKGSFDLIISNPPIHAGIKTDNRMGIRLLESVHEHLMPGGILIMVANIHLPYEKWLSQTFRHCTRRLANDSYKVLLAKK
jgi:16S rRNA (guanine1207-N2)-methyltransferase